jgi:hypothetical protein
MQKKIFGSLFLFLSGMLIFVSCAKDTLVAPVPVVIPPNLKISFKDTIQPIFTANCMGSGCHSGSTSPNLTVGNAYNSLRSGGFLNTASPAQSILYIQMAPGGGMSGHCTVDEANLVLAWITKGALDN